VPSRNRPQPRRRRILVLAVAAMCVLVTGCRLATTTAQGTNTPAASITAAAVPAVGQPVVTDRGWDPAGLHGPVPAAGSCHLRHAASGNRCRTRCAPRVRLRRGIIWRSFTGPLIVADDTVHDRCGWSAVQPVSSRLRQ